MPFLDNADSNALSQTSFSIQLLLSGEEESDVLFIPLFQIHYLPLEQPSPSKSQTLQDTFPYCRDIVDIGLGWIGLEQD
jgi:hypothetical protein